MQNYIDHISWRFTVEYSTDFTFLNVLSTLPFEGEKGAHGGDHGLPDGDGRGQGGQMAVGEVQGEQRHGGQH